MAESTIQDSDESTKIEAKNSLSRALEHEKFYVEDHEGHFFVANGLGLVYGRLPGQFQDLSRKLETAHRCPRAPSTRPV